MVGILINRTPESKNRFFHPVKRLMTTKDGIVVGGWKMGGGGQ